MKLVVCCISTSCIFHQTPIAAWFGQDRNSVIVGCSNGQLSNFDCKTDLKKKSDHACFRGKHL